MRAGRRAYVVTLAGADQLKGAFGAFTVSMSGYALVDAATGLYSERDVVTVMTLNVRAGQESMSMQIRGKERFDLKF